MAGPFIKNQKLAKDRYGNARRVENRTWYTQPKPYKAPLPYKLFVGRYLSGVNSRDAGSWAMSPSNFTTERQRLIISVRERLRSQLSEQAQIGAAVAEAQGSLDMIRDRAMQMVQFVRNFKRGKLPPGTRMRRPKIQGEVSETKRVASTFLEYHFGWSPFIGDIYAACDAIQQPIPFGKYHAKDSFSKRLYERSSGPYWSSTEYNVTMGMRSQTLARVSNPNLWLANSMGLINPATVAWEVVPYSFVVDWFTPVSGFLSQLGQYSGLELLHASTTFRTTILRKEAVYYAADSATVEGFWLERQVGIPTATLPSPKFPQLNPWQAASAVSLLVLELKSLGLNPL